MPFFYTNSDGLKRIDEAAKILREVQSICSEGTDFLDSTPIRYLLFFKLATVGQLLATGTDFDPPQRKFFFVKQFPTLVIGEAYFPYHETKRRVLRDIRNTITHGLYAMDEIRQQELLRNILAEIDKLVDLNVTSLPYTPYKLEDSSPLKDLSPSVADRGTGAAAAASAMGDETLLQHMLDIVERFHEFQAPAFLARKDAYYGHTMFWLEIGEIVNLLGETSATPELKLEIPDRNRLAHEWISESSITSLKKLITEKNDYTSICRVVERLKKSTSYRHIKDRCDIFLESITAEVQMEQAEDIRKRKRHLRDTELGGAGGGGAGAGAVDDYRSVNPFGALGSSGDSSDGSRERTVATDKTSGSPTSSGSLSISTDHEGEHEQTEGTATAESSGSSSDHGDEGPDRQQWQTEGVSGADEDAATEEEKDGQCDVL